ncbi:MAG: DUF418 domain-containing protein, partial [Candidatus Promineifilaceae bacterium]
MSQDTFVQQSDRGGQAGPVREHERISVVDILRGFAILGILLVNMYSFAGMQLNPGSYTGLNRIVVILVLLFAQAKFYSLFSFLFGWGMWIQMSRAIAKGISVVPLFVRRMLILLAIGILHGIFIWTGDILTIYAVLGLLLILFRKSSERTLLIAAGLFLLIPIIVNLPGAAMDGFREWYAETTEFLRTFGSQNDGIYSYGTYQEITEARLQAFVGGQTWFIYWIGNVFAMFLLGFYAGKKGYFENLAEKRRLFRRTQIIGLVVGLLFAGFSVLVMVRPETVSPAWQSWVRIATRTIGAPALMLFYVSTITLLSQREPWTGRLASLAPVGRMALTNYLMQSILLTLLFYGYGLALYGEIGPTVGLILTLIVYGSQIRFSAWWLERYRFGPMEWLWRTLTYGRMQPLRRGVSSSEMREIPVLSRLRRWLTAVPPLVFLILVWIGLLLWGIGLYRWNQQLKSDVYENPFSSPSQSITETIPPDGQVADQTPADQEADDKSSAILPDVQPVEYRPGPTASSGDMQALAETFDSTRAIEQIEILASREYAGRLAGSETGRAAGDYIADRMDAYGLQPGGYDGSFFQSFPLTYTLLTGPPNLSITTNDGVVKDDYQLYEDFAPFIAGYAGGGEASGEVYWVNRCQPQDFRGLDVVGKIVLCYAAGSGAENTANSRRALEYGAEGLLLLADPEQRPADLGYRHAEVWVRRSIPVLFVYEDAVADLFQGSSISPDMSFKDIDPSLLAVSANMSVEASEPQVVEARNVLGVLPGRDPQFSDEVVVIGAHYDHMGISPDGTYWAGANDNASGTAAVLEIARSWNQEGYVPRRTVVFAAWDAEEWGLIGSTLYAYQPSYPLENTIASIQMDMVGTGGDTLRIDGGGVFAAQLKDIADEMEIESALTDEGRSDHIPFLRAGVPAALLIWDYSEGQTPSYHRPTDVVTVIDPEQLNAAGTLANTALLDLVESEPAIRGALLTRAKAALENDRTVFLSTSRQDQLDIDNKWFEDLQSFEPTAVGMSAENLEIEGDSAAGDVHIWVQHPGQDTEQITETLSVDLPVQFSRIGAEWLWAGPSLIWAQRPEGEALTGGVTPIDIAAPAGIDEEEASNLWKVGDEAAYQYAELARLLGLEEETDSSIILLPDAEAVRASTALSLPSDKESWIGPGLVKLVYQENISQTQSLATAMAQLLLANAGVREEAAPWLWWGLSAALQVEQDGTAVQQSIVPILYEQLRSDSAEINSSTAWAAVDYLIESAGWDGLGRFIVDLGRECDRGECQDGAGLDSALQRALGQSSDSFSQAWRDQWLSRLESAQNQLDALLSTRANAILTGDENSYLSTVYFADE